MIQASIQAMTIFNFDLDGCQKWLFIGQQMAWNLSMAIMTRTYELKFKGIVIQVLIKTNHNSAKIEGSFEKKP